jgi:hypothetical protein
MLGVRFDNRGHRCETMAQQHEDTASLRRRSLRRRAQAHRPAHRTLGSTMTSPTAGPRHTLSPPLALEPSDSPEIGPAPRGDRRRPAEQAGLPPGDAPQKRARAGSPGALGPRSPLPSLTSPPEQLAELNAVLTAAPAALAQDRAEDMRNSQPLPFFAAENPGWQAVWSAQIPQEVASHPFSDGHRTPVPPPVLKQPHSDEIVPASGADPHYSHAQAALAQERIENIPCSQPLPFFATENPGIVWQAPAPREPEFHPFGDSPRAPSPPPALEQPGSPEIGPAPPEVAAPPSPSHSVTVQAELSDQLQTALALQPAAPTPLSREEMGLPARPTTPSLMAKMKADSEKTSKHKAALGRDVVSMKHALRNEALQQELLDECIDPISRARSPDGQVRQWRATITPFFERAEREALECLKGLTEADMSLENQAVLMTAVIRAHLGKLTVFDEHGQVAEWLAPDPNLPGGPTTSVARTLAQRSAEKGLNWSSYEGGRLTLLAAAYANAVLGLNDAQAKQVVNRVGGRSLRALQFALKLQAVGERLGPFAIALVLKLFEPVWAAQRSTNAAADGEARRVNVVPTNHRAALVDALLRLPEETMDDLIRAADSPDNLKKVCEHIEGLMRADADYKAINVFRVQSLHHALQRLQGRPYLPNSIAYNGAGPTTEALEWLKEVKQRTSQS